ncbi:MAG: hypothetical protein AAGB00_05230 [Planctomycetota bacterium]
MACSQGFPTNSAACKPTGAGRRLAALCLAAACAFATASPALGQAIESDPLNPDPALRRSGSVVKNWIKRPDNNPERVKQFEAYFDGYYFPSLTRSDQVGLGDLGKLRYDLFRQYIDPASPQVRQQLVDKTYSFATRVISGRAPDKRTRRRYHNAVQYNAVLMLGSLTADGEAPLPKANNFLVQVLEFASAKRLPTHLQAGALVALGGQADKIGGLKPDAQQKMVNALAKATREASVASDAGPLTKDWVRRRAALALAEAAKTVKNPAVVSLLVKLVGDESLTLDSRAAVAASLEGLPLDAASGAPVAVLKLAGAIAADELEEANGFEELQINASGRRGASEFIDSVRYRFGREQGDLEYIREGLAARLTKLQEGLQAVEPAAGPQAASGPGIGREPSAEDE